MKPQYKGIVISSCYNKPKKPNSALRLIVKVLLTNNKLVLAYVPRFQLVKLIIIQLFY